MSRSLAWRTARQQFALHRGAEGTDWYRIRNQHNGPTQLHIYDEIGYFGVSASNLIRDLADVNGPVEVHINSPGGEVFDGIAIYNTLLARRDVAVYIDGIAASIASVIAMAGNPVLVARQGQMMIHEGFAMAIGNAQDMRDLAEQLDRTSGDIASIYSEHTGKPVDYWRQLMKAETWIDSQRAIDEGLADRFIDNGNGHPPRNNWDLGVFRNAHQMDAAHQPYHGRDDVHHGPTSGMHSHNHAAFSASDGDDGIHAHGHAHADGGDALHNHPHEMHSHQHGHDDIPHQHAHSAGQGSYGPHTHDHVHHQGHDQAGDGDGDTGYTYGEAELLTHIMNTSYTEILNWDADAAFAKCKSPSDFRSISAGEHTSGDPNTKAHWALPHHTAPGAGPDKGGVVAALGRWNQTQGLKNKQAALSHLKAHARTLGLPSGDDNSIDTTQYSEADAAAFASVMRGLRK